MAVVAAFCATCKIIKLFVRLKLKFRLHDTTRLRSVGGEDDGGVATISGSGSATRDRREDAARKDRRRWTQT